MLIGHFTEQPWQDDSSGLMGTQSTDLGISNSFYNPAVGASLYNRYLDEKLYAEEMGFDAFMLNEHHSTPFCMQGVTNIGAAILARQTLSHIHILRCTRYAVSRYQWSPYH